MEIAFKTIGFGGDIEDSEGAWESREILHNGERVGSVTVQTWADGSALIERIDVDEEKRGQGIGTATINAMVEEFGSCYIVPDNADAARLYARLGREVSAAGDWTYLDQGYGVFKV